MIYNNNSIVGELGRQDSLGSSLNPVNILGQGTISVTNNINGKINSQSSLGAIQINPINQSVAILNSTSAIEGEIGIVTSEEIEESLSKKY